MKKIVLNKDLTLYFNKYFPITRRKKKHFKHLAVVGIGANMGNIIKTFENVYRYFSKDKRFFILETSPILKNPPFGFLEQKDFLNAILVLQTSLSAKELLKNLLHVEKINKRKRSFKNAPRSLDLDIIFYDNLNIRTKKLSIPHPAWNKRESVIIPLSFIKRIAW